MSIRYIRAMGDSMLVKMHKVIEPTEFYSPSNTLSLLRLALVGPTIYYLLHNDQRKALSIIVVSMVTDVVDGPLARRRDEVSELGKLIDPLADKLMLDSIAVVLSLKRDFPWGVTYLLLARDVAIITGAVFIFRRTTYVTPAIFSGKATTAMLSMALLLYLLDVQPWGQRIMRATLIPMTISWVQYGARAWYWLRGHYALVRYD
jgi:CDP-diacylglycerol--glycerol-3-phosphate 3-phosphatidyltransferase